MGAPVLVEGVLYIDRDHDVRTDTWGRYVKIGIVRDKKSPEQRVSELQVGNPRKVHTIKTYNSPMVENLETRLHHNFADRWVRGEWFEMSEDFVENELNEIVEKYIQEQNMYLDFHVSRKELQQRISNGQRRAPTKHEEKLHDNFIEIKKTNDVLNAKSQIVKYKLMAELDRSGGVKSIIQLRKSFTPAKTVAARLSLDKEKFKTKFPDKFNEFVTITLAKPKGSLLIKKTPNLAKVDPVLKDELEMAKNYCNRMKVELCDLGPMEANDKIKEIHFDYISLLGAIFDSNLEMERIKSELSSLLGEDEAIEGIVEWKRVESLKEKFDSEAAEEKYPNEFNECMVEIPEKSTPERVRVSIIVEMNREYAL